VDFIRDWLVHQVARQKDGFNSNLFNKNIIKYTAYIIDFQIIVEL